MSIDQCTTLKTGGSVPICFPWQAGGGQGVSYDNNQAGTLSKSQTLAVCVTGECTHALQSEGSDASEDGTGRGTPIIAIQERACAESLTSGPGGCGMQEDIAYTLEARHHAQAVAFDLRQITSKANRTRCEAGLPVPALNTDAGMHVAFAQNVRNEVRLCGGDGQTISALGAEQGTHQTPRIAESMAVRRLTPRECERLQGWPDDHTLVPYRGKPMADGPRYKIIGNGWALPCVQWIARRIVAEIEREAEAYYDHESGKTDDPRTGTNL
jgi:DNA (cytosine-5)-methyltransferase 1